jgi:hypothetical protein
MGGGRWDDDRYTKATATRRSTGVDDFEYSKAASKVHENLDPKRINKKPFGKLESRDSKDHPESNAIVVCFDVTGSNIQNAQEAQKKLPNLMKLLEKYIPDPQIAVAANDDINVQGTNSIQFSDFESDNRIDEHIRNVWLTGDGGGNDGESYDLLMYAAARKTVLDCFEKRGRKGYFFMYADEPIFPQVKKVDVATIFGDKIQHDIPVVEIIEDLRKLYHVYVIWPGGSQHGYEHAKQQYLKLFGEESVLVLQHPNLICEMIGGVIGLNEERVGDSASLKRDLLEAGTSGRDAEGVATSLAPLLKGKVDKAGSLPKTGRGGASRL